MVYQTASFSIPAISRHAATRLFGQELLQEHSTPTETMWLATTVAQVRKLVESIMKQSGYICAGATRALKTKSERWCRVVAHIIPMMRIVHVSKRDTLQIDFQYVLLDETGELHAPKDENRNEMHLSQSIVNEVRAQIRLDLTEMALESRARLSPSFLRHLGMDQEAMRLEAETSQLHQQLSQGRRASRVPRWEVNRIVEQRGSRNKREYLVEWSGYHASWEAWRVNGPGGEVGSPLQTWEPAHALKGTAALEEWLSQE